ncbi:hypothetical protein B0G38_003711 [Arthrobacter sp. VKM Ac-2550]|nr:hypothetical protein [Arthrobacter sp. VKM Ac-2550]MCW2134527.1 hypothetical protein [Arthrobacter sp. VKM Ac-2550]
MEGEPRLPSSPPWPNGLAASCPPGIEPQTDEELQDYIRKTHNTVMMIGERCADLICTGQTLQTTTADANLSASLV